MATSKWHDEAEESLPLAEQRRDGNASGRQRMEIHMSFSVTLSLRQYKHPDGNIKEAVKRTGSQYGGEGKLRGPLGPSV